MVPVKIPEDPGVGQVDLPIGICIPEPVVRLWLFLGPNLNGRVWFGQKSTLDYITPNLWQGSTSYKNMVGLE